MKKQIRKMTISLVFVICMSVLIPLLEMENTAKAADTLDYSGALNMNGEWSKDYWFDAESYKHYYNIVIPSDGYFEFKIMSYIGNGCDFELYSADLSERYWGGGYLAGCGTGRGSESSPSTGSRYTSLSKGNYVLIITSDEEGRYKLWSSYTPYNVNDENANSYDSPQNLIDGNAVTGALTETDIEDWYRIQINKKGYYTFFWKNYVNYKGHNGANCKLYSSDLLSTIFNKEIYGASYSEPKTWKEDIELDKGTYYLKIEASIGLFGDWVAAGKYILSWESLTQGNCNHKYVDKRVYSTYFYKGYTQHRCEKCGKTYKDNYVTKKKLGQGSISSLSISGKGKLQLRWYMVTDASGYQIRYCRSKKMKSGVKTQTVRGYSKTKKTIKKLSRKKKYYVQIRAYKKSGTNTVYGKWSSKKCLKTK